MKQRITVFLFVFVCFKLNAQDKPLIDTLELARNSAYQKDFATADSLLSAYNKNHKDVHALRLHAQVLYWTKDFNGALALYEKTLLLFPDEAVVKLEYGRTLFNLNKLSKARAILDDYMKTDSSNAEANIMRAYIDLWNGHMAAAKRRSLLLLKLYPGNADAEAILDKVRYYTAPYLKASAGFSSDDQPRRGEEYSFETGVYRSFLLAPVAQASIYNFHSLDSTYRSLWVRLKNTIQTGSGFSLVFGGGIFQQASTNTSHFTGNISLSQVVAKRFSLNAGFEKLPYQYSLASLKKAVINGVTSLAVGYNKDDKWLAKAGYEQQHFEDDNNIGSSYFWLLAPMVHKNNFSLKAGYAFSFANSDQNKFINKESLSKLMGSTPLHGTVGGVYDPYFTPQNQTIHSLLASVKIGLSKNATITSRASIGVSAKADNPNLTLEKHANQFFIQKQYATISYTPVTWVTELQAGLSKKLFIGINYTFDQLLFYTSNQGSLQLKYLFLHE